MNVAVTTANYTGYGKYKNEWENAHKQNIFDENKV